MSKILVMLLALALSFSLSACNAEPLSGREVLDCTVKEVRENAILVWGKSETDLYEIPTKGFDMEFTAGEQLRITHSGEIQEVYPCIIPHVYKIEKVQ